MNLNEVFKEFISVVQENNKYIIGLLDNDGTVVLCSEQNYSGIHMDIDRKTTKDFYHKIFVKNIDFGYLWVSSDDDSLKMVGSLLGESLNTRILYEINEDLLKSNITKDDELIKYFLDDTNFDMKHVLKLAAELNLNPNITRTAVLVYNSKGFNVDEILHLKVKLKSKELIYSLLDNVNLLFYKDVPSDLPSAEIKGYIMKFIRELQSWGLRDCCYIAGSPQNKLTLYSSSYRNCMWVKNNMNVKKDRPVFFTDYLFDYFISLVPLAEVACIFDYARQSGKSIDIDELIQISDSLYNNDYNISQTAEELFLHKNSLIYKIRKYEDIFDINIRGSFQGKLFLHLISRTLKEEKQQKQVGVKS